MRLPSEWTGSSAPWHKHGAWRDGRGPEDDPTPPISTAAFIPRDPKWKGSVRVACWFLSNLLKCLVNSYKLPACQLRTI